MLCAGVAFHKIQSRALPERENFFRPGKNQVKSVQDSAVTPKTDHVLERPAPSCNDEVYSDANQT